MITSASFIVTERCNLACSYCFEREWRECRRERNDMTVEAAQTGMKWLYDNAVASGAKQVSVILFGGEPLLNVARCVDILETGLSLERLHGIPFKANLITNGTVMNRDVEFFLYKYAAKMPGFTVQLSIDGTQEAHDLYRVNRRGEGSFDAAWVNVDTYMTAFKNRLSVHGCVNKQTLPMLFDSYFTMAERGFQRIWYMPVHTEDWTMDDVQEYDRQLGMIFDDMCKRKQMSIYSPIDKCLSGDRPQPEKTCGAGCTFATITPSGGIWPCHNIYFNDPERTQRVGNVLTGEFLADVLKPYEAYSTKTLGCGDCDNTACYRCIADNWAVNDDINAQVGKPMRCAMSSVERRYQLAAKEYADKHFVPQNLTEAAARRTLLKDVAELKRSMAMLLISVNKEVFPGGDNGSPESEAGHGEIGGEGNV